ncbi:MAG: hypothetical protein HFJ29_09145 [Clostridia bacterium]|nr:hypothetical protein [Clostridia bacterium]
MTTKKTENIITDYLNGMTYKDIFKKYNITLSDLKKIINKNKLTRSKSELLKGNQNAKNNKGGKGAAANNKNAVTTGEYEKLFEEVLTDEEKALFKNYKMSDMDNLLMEEYIAEYKLLTIRELRMMRRIKKLERADKDMTIGHIRKKNSDGATETVTEAEATVDKIQRIEDGLTRVTESKRKSRENMIKLGFSKRELELKEKQAEDDLW